MLLCQGSTDGEAKAEDELKSGLNWVKLYLRWPLWNRQMILIQDPSCISFDGLSYFQFYYCGKSLQVTSLFHPFSSSKYFIKEFLLTIGHSLIWTIPW